MYNGEDIRRRQLELKNNLLKGFGVVINEVDEDEFEKAHKQGDLHPNGKWYWESSAAGGKGDWRTIGGRRHKASQGTQSKGDGNNWNKELNSEISKLGKRLGVAVKNNETKKEDLRAAREKLGYLQDNEERLIKRDGKEKYDKRLKQAKEEVAKLKSNKEPEKKVYDVTLGWNKKDQSTYNQIDKITDILEERGELSDWPFRSISQAQKRISFSEASNIISALSRGERIKIYI